MAWIEKKEEWFGERKRNNGKPQKIERSYSVSEVAELCGTSRQTVFKWLSIDEPEGAVIPVVAWYRLPSGHIRIREWVVVQLQK